MDFIYLLLFVFTGSRKFAIISQQKCVVLPTAPPLPPWRSPQCRLNVPEGRQRQHFSNKAPNWFNAVLIRCKCPLSSVTTHSDESPNILNSTLLKDTSRFHAQCAMTDKMTLVQHTTKLSRRYFIWQLLLPLPVDSYNVLIQRTQTTDHTRGGVAAEVTNFSCHTEQGPCVTPLTPKSLHQIQRKPYIVFSQKFIVFILSIKFLHQNLVSISCLAINSLQYSHSLC